MNPLMQLRDHGQSYWLDDLTRQTIASGDLARRIGSEDLRGVTSNPSIFAKALQQSTSTKNPRYPDLMYVEPLVGPFTINTMPEEAIAACREHGHIGHNTVEHDLADARRVMADLERLGISIDFVTTQLESEGIQKFIKAFDSILVQLATERERAVSSR